MSITPATARNADARPDDRFTSRARPAFLYVMYTLLLGSLPVGLLSALRPQMARDVTSGMAAYLSAIPEPLYALFGTGYVGYTFARTWGKTQGTER